MGEKPSRTYDEAAVRFLTEQSEKADYDSKIRHIRHFRQAFGGRKLDTLTRDEIFLALPQKDFRTGHDRKVSNATRNRYLATIRAMLNDAADMWEWIGRAPKLKDSQEGATRIRWITQAEAQRLLNAITLQWLRDVTLFGFATGLRQANILELEWSRVDLVRRRAWVHPDQAKARKSIGVPLNPEDVEVIRRQIGKHQRFVFTRKGKPIKSWGAAQWKHACARAEITNFRFHDVRHTWASWHVQNGTPLEKLKELGGWATYEMVLRYAHLAPDHLAEHANAVTVWAQNTPDMMGAGNKKAG